MTIAVVVPCRNEAAHISNLLDAIATQTRPVTEVIVVDDQSTDGTLDVVARWGANRPERVVRTVAGRGLGPGPAMNDGIAATTCDIIVRLDGHCVPAATYVERALEVLAETGAGITGGVWEIAPGAPTPVARAIAAVVSHPLGSGGAAYRDAGEFGPVRVTAETVPFGVFGRSVWITLGGYDESLAANEDFDFNYRARLAGFPIILDRRMRTTYFARPTLATLRRQYFRYGFWKRQMLRKDPRALHLRQLPPVLLLPWLMGTLTWLALMPGLPSAVTVSVYPLLIMAAALQIGITRGVNPVAAAAALATVHISWGAGFLRASLGIA